MRLPGAPEARGRLAVVRRRGGGGIGPTSRARGYRVRQKRERGDRLRDGSAASRCAETPVEDENNNCWHLRAETTYNHRLALSAFPRLLRC